MLVRPLSVLVPNHTYDDIDRHVLSAKTAFKVMRDQDCYQILEPGMMVYRITDTNRSYTGIILGIDISNFNDDTIVHHERTIAKKVQKQTEVAKEEGGFSKPILLTNRPIPEVGKIINLHINTPPLIDAYIEKHQSQHQIWPITDTEQLATIAAAYAQRDHSYIVDGHHRTAAIQALSKDTSIQHGLCAMFDIEELEILPFHRIIDTAISSTELISKLSTIGTIEPLSVANFPTHVNEVTIIVEDHAFRFKWNPEITRNADAVSALDVNLISKHILKRILNIEQDDTSKIGYLEGNHSIDQIQSKITKNQIAILLHPISIEDLINITNEGHRLPAKSTWFLPRMANGIVSMTLR